MAWGSLAKVLYLQGVKPREQHSTQGTLPTYLPTYLTVIYPYVPC